MEIPADSRAITRDRRRLGRGRSFPGLRLGSSPAGQESIRPRLRDLGGLPGIRDRLRTAPGWLSTSARGWSGTVRCHRRRAWSGYNVRDPGHIAVELAFQQYPLGHRRRQSLSGLHRTSDQTASGQSPAGFAGKAGADRFAPHRRRRGLEPTSANRWCACAIVPGQVPRRRITCW